MLEITHRLLTRHTKGLVLVAKVSGRSQGLSSTGERRKEAQGGVGYLGVGNCAGMKCHKQKWLILIMTFKN